MARRERDVDVGARSAHDLGLRHDHHAAHVGHGGARRHQCGARPAPARRRPRHTARVDAHAVSRDVGRLLAQPRDRLRAVCRRCGLQGHAAVSKFNAV